MPNFDQNDPQLVKLSASSGSSLVGFQQAGTGSVATTVQAKLQHFVDVLDYGADPTGVADSTAAFILAHNVSPYLIVGKGTWLLNNYRPINGETWWCAGYDNTIIKQSNAANPALNILSDVSSGQLLGNSFTKFQVTGAVGASVAAIVVGATAPYAIRDMDLDYTALNTYCALSMGGATVSYRCKIAVQSQTSQVRITTSGSYNIYDIFTTGCVADSTALFDLSTSSFFPRAIAEAGLFFGGAQNTIALAVVENWTGVASGASAITSANTNVIENAYIINVPNASSNVGFNQNSIGGVWINATIYGTAPATAPSYPIESVGGTTFINVKAGGGFKIEQYLSAAVIASCQFLGDASTYSYQRQFGQSQPVHDLGAAVTYTLDASLATLGLDSVLRFAAAGTVTLTLPSGAAWAGREVTVFTTTAQLLNSASVNIIPMTGAAGTAILAATIGKWAKLKADATAANWYIIENN